MTDNKQGLITATSKLHFCYLNYVKSTGFFSSPERNAEFPVYLLCYYLVMQQ